MSDDIISNFLYKSNLPGYLFINEYPVFGIVWNLFLLVVPFVIFHYLVKYYHLTKIEKRGQKVFFGFLFFLWLIFLPNSAYIITDVRHLMNYCPYSFYRVCSKNAWMIIIFFTYALIGWAAFVLLLDKMKNFVTVVYSKQISNLFIISVIPLVSIGVLLGLLNRWNSWEIFYFPKSIIRDLLLYVTDWNYFLDFSVFTVFFYFLYYFGSYLFEKK